MGSKPIVKPPYSFLAAALLALSGCTIERQEAADTEALLAVAGFLQQSTDRLAVPTS